MLQLINHTPFAASLSVFADADGVESAYAIVKASFQLHTNGLVLAEQQVPLIATDLYWDDPLTSSIRYPGEFCLPKPATDVLLMGHAYAPRDNIRLAEASLRLGSISKTLHVFGNRQWQNTARGWEASTPEVWQRMPLRWELAFGGVAPQTDDQPPIFEPSNPIGRGFLGRHDKTWAGSPLPNIENPAQLIKQPSDKPQPACFAAIAPAWLARSQYAGTYDAHWQQHRAPYLPKDFDSRYLLTAPSDQIVPGYLQGGEVVEITGCSPHGVLRFQLPVCSLALVFNFDGKPITYRPKLETVLLEPDMLRVQLQWRAGMPVDKHLLKLKEVAIHCREYRKSASEVAA